jgi:hypothetical protein
MTSQPDRVSHLWRRFLRFSVWGLIVLLLVLGAGVGWIVRQARIQRDAVVAIMKAGGSVKYDWEWSNGKNILGGKPWAPLRFVNLIGVDYFGHVTAVEFSAYPGATDATLKKVGRLTRVQALYANSPSLSDAGLAHLTGLTNLFTLDLAGTRVTDAGLAHLTGLSQLKQLYLRGTHVTDGGAKELNQALPSLKIIR